MSLEEILGGRVEKTEHGELLIVEKPVEELGFNGLTTYIQENRELTLNQIKKRFPQVRTKKGLVFFDVESCGFGRSNPAIAIIYTRLYPEIVSKCLFARNYSEEEAMIGSCVGGVNREDNIFFSYNGLSFDLDLLSNRAIQNGIMLNSSGVTTLKQVLSKRHIDLYQEVMKSPSIRKKGLLNYKLKTVEGELFNHVRLGDISGKRIGEEYRKYIYGRDIKGNPVEDNTEQIKRIVRHGILDTISLAGIFCYLCRNK